MLSMEEGFKVPIFPSKPTIVEDTQAEPSETAKKRELEIPYRGKIKLVQAFFKNNSNFFYFFST